MPVINRDAFQLWGNAQDFNENSEAGSSDQLAAKPVSLLGWGCKELGGVQVTPAKGSQSWGNIQWTLVQLSWLFNYENTFIPVDKLLLQAPKGLLLPRGPCPGIPALPHNPKTRG